MEEPKSTGVTSGQLQGRLGDNRSQSCPDDACAGDRFFDPVDEQLFVGRLDDGYGQTHHAFLRYKCGDCNHEEKTFALRYRVQEIWKPPIERAVRPPRVTIACTKVGETPKPITRLNPKAKNLISDHWDLYRKGAECEAIGAGIGAFAYYRRVVEDSRDRIIDEICRAAERQNRPKDEIAKIRDLKNSQRFTESAKKIQSSIPKELFIEGHNPLTLLFEPLSNALHGASDDECLKAAADIRRLLDRFGANVKEVIEDQQENLAAITRLEALRKK